MMMLGRSMDSVELLVNVTPSETRIALVDMGILKEVHIERQAKRGIVGNIYKGRVTRVLPGMQSAFVDIGLEKAAFLHASDIVSHTECVEESEQKQFVVKDICGTGTRRTRYCGASGERSFRNQRGTVNHRYHFAFTLLSVYA